MDKVVQMVLGSSLIFVGAGALAGVLYHSTQVLQQPPKPPMLSHYETLSDRVQRIQDPENLLRVGITPEDKETLEMYMAVQPYGQLLADKYHADLQKFHYKKRSGAVFGTGVFFIGLLIGGHYVSRRIGQNKQAASSRYSSVPDKVEPAEY